MLFKHCKRLRPICHHSRSYLSYSVLHRQRHQICSNTILRTHNTAVIRLTQHQCTVAKFYPAGLCILGVEPKKGTGCAKEPFSTFYNSLCSFISMLTTNIQPKKQTPLNHIISFTLNLMTLAPQWIHKKAAKETRSHKSF